jgi:hypothetical protein
MRNGVLTRWERSVITRTERPLTDPEREKLTARLAHARSEASRVLVKTVAASAAVCGVLIIATLLASTAPRPLIVGFWLVMAGLFTVWIGLPGRRLMLSQIPALEDALRTTRARVVRVQSEHVVEFEEVEDEGACYAFETDPARVVFIVGQEFYEGDDFPNADFSMIEVLGSRGTPVDIWVEKSGRKLMPDRVVPAKVKWTLELPDHLAVVDVPLDRVEDLLPKQSP